MRRLARTRRVDLHIDSKRGKGSHEVRYYAGRRTIVRNPKDVLKKGTLHAMLRDLGLNLMTFNRSAYMDRFIYLANLTPGEEDGGYVVTLPIRSARRM